MGYGSTVAVEEAEENWRDECKKRVRSEAAKHVGARTKTRAEAIDFETELLRQDIEADNDPSGTLASMIIPPKPSKSIPEAQQRAIEAELDDLASSAVKTL